MSSHQGSESREPRNTNTLQLSESGQQKVADARRLKGWNTNDDRWLDAASKVLEPDQDWQEAEIFAAGISRATLGRFLGKIAIRPDPFKAFCTALGLQWQDVVLIGEEYRPPLISSRKQREDRYYQLISQPGSLLRIKGPQYMGKTKMLNRIMLRLRKTQPHSQIVVINFQQQFDRSTFSSLDRFLENFCICVNYTFDLNNDVHEYWTDTDGTVNHKTTVYFETRVFSQINHHLILILEGIDCVFKYDFAQDFCQLLRGWYSAAQREEQQWEKLSLVIVHSTEVYAKFDIRNSPLENVGEIVTLTDFDRSEVADLVQQYNLHWHGNEIDRLMALVGGNPYLVDVTLRTIVTQAGTLDTILETATTAAGIYGNRLRQLLGIINENPVLKDAFKKIVTAPEAVEIDPFQIYQLDSIGLIKMIGNSATPAYPLYRQYFSRILRGEDS